MVDNSRIRSATLILVRLKRTTKDDIKQAFILLLSKNNLNDISVSQLTKKAGINRSTFYLNYIDKEDFLQQLKEKTMQDIAEILERKKGNPQTALEEVLTYFTENISLFSQIAQKHEFSFADNVRSSINGVIEGTPSSVPVIVDTFKMPKRYAINMFVSGFIGVITEWLIKGAQESPQELTKIIMNTPSMVWFSGKG